MSVSPQEYTAATKAIESAQRILVVPHANVDPDGLGSALACFEFFKAIGKEVTVICPESPPESLGFLPGIEKVQEGLEESQQFIVTVNLEEGMEVDKLRYTVEDRRVNIIVVPKHGHIRPQNISLSEGEQQYDLIVVVDTADLSLLGSVYTDHLDLFSNVPILNIDHHISNTGFGQLKLLDPTAASATEVLYRWFTQDPAWSQKITADISTLLLTGLITDTRSFQNPNTTPRSLEIAAVLLEKGARQQEIIQHVYKTKPLSTLRIWGRALNRIQMDSQAGVVWSAVSREDLAEMEATSKETSGILDDLISTVPNADIYVLFTELEEGGLKASMRSSTAIDASSLAAKLFGGGGHPRAAGFRVPTFDNFQLQVLECVRQLKDGMRMQQSEKMAGTLVTSQHAKIPSITEKPHKDMVQEDKIEESGDITPADSNKSVYVVEEIVKKEKNVKGETDVVGELGRS
ncbi:bifunctional oligoribonuclease/PAP phosphatase NrnA [Patescibacteria group bacterium]|nr:bifunctional oligoribonuclease/PAP phosphatase NrnA [Patescibacteria group bacterium]